MDFIRHYDRLSSTEELLEGRIVVVPHEVINELRRGLGLMRWACRASHDSKFFEGLMENEQEFMKTLYGRDPRNGGYILESCVPRISPSDPNYLATRLLVGESAATLPHKSETGIRESSGDVGLVALAYEISKRTKRDVCILSNNSDVLALTSLSWPNSSTTQIADSNGHAALFFDYSSGVSMVFVNTRISWDRAFRLTSRQ
jgi:hypothetical protein